MTLFAHHQNNTAQPLAADLALDVLVVGNGPAGAASAQQLAGHCRVGLLGRAQAGGPVIGESLPAAARVLLADMGLLPAFAAQRHRPAYARTSLWGDARPSQRDSLQDPHGHGWHLNRAHFDDLLRDAAVQRGAIALWPAELRSIRHSPGSPAPWQCVVQQGSTQVTISCRLLIDASGRSAKVARHAGVNIERVGRLVCLHSWLPAAAGQSAGSNADPGCNILPGTTLVEAVKDGWWYSADLPQGGCVIALHTDSDLPTAKACRSTHDLLALARQTRLISQRCSTNPALGDAAATALGIAAAHSQWASQAAGADWFAVGDAALAFDPLASQGLMNSLYTGLHAAHIAQRHLAGDTQALPQWAKHLSDITRAYTGNLAHYYAMEQRWPDAPFWQRRNTQHAGRASGNPSGNSFASPQLQHA